MLVDGYFQFLVIVLSIFLAVFLLLGIIFLYKAIEITNQLKKIVDKAEHLVEKAEHISAIIGKTAAPVALGRFLSSIVDFVKQKGGKKKGKKDE